MATQRESDCGIAARVCILLVRGYQRTLSRLKPPVCRFTPSCSHYAIDAFKIHGFWKGMALTAWRILRCNPFYSGNLVDPVPPPKPK
ncbi:MAG: membrane protein insertion efficiency factor YidD [Lentisphaeria bacterium]|nr:membrane protein insertion efficiency factor YidD [Lentisphaeria bacterium]